MYFLHFIALLMTLKFSDAADRYMIDDTQGLERRFDGIGGISGGGATSRLLVNYPQKQRDQILDYLFKPNFAASLHMLKVEIGGDAQSTDGTESSHMHSKDDLNFERGYEWWLMKEAKKRNPDILLYGLPWAFPGWIGDGARNPYQNRSLTADYICKWIEGAKNVHNLTINYIGIWNEKPYDVEYIKLLRDMLNERGFSHVQIVASDGGWSIMNDIYADKKLAQIVDYIGVHYPGTYSTMAAYLSKKPLWSSEDFSTFNDNIGAGCWARVLNQNYVNGYMTSTISWNLIASYYEALPFARDGLMTASTPWSGHYVVESPIWITAHTTQFTSPGWMYLPHEKGVGKLLGGGSYVSLVSPDQKDLTVIIETMSYNHSICIRPPLAPYDVKPQNITLQFKGSFVNIQQVYVWYSKLEYGGKESTFLKSYGLVKVSNGMVSLNLGLDEVITITTLSTGQKGTYPTPPPTKPFPLPYEDNFDAYSVYSEPYNFAQQSGTYEVIQESSHNKVLRQMVTRSPVASCDPQLLNKSLNIHSIHSRHKNVDEYRSSSMLGINGNIDYMLEDHGFIKTKSEILFDRYLSENVEPPHFAQQVGVFETRNSTDTKHGIVLTQVVTEAPLHWCFFKLMYPIDVIGNYSWSNIMVEVDTMIPSCGGSSGVFVAVRVDRGGCDAAMAKGIFFFLFPTQQKYTVTNNLVQSVVIHKGPANCSASGWNKISLLVQGNYAVGTLNGAVLFNITLPKSPIKGFVAIGTDTYGIANFDNFKIANAPTKEETDLREKSHIRDKDTLYFVETEH